MTQPTEYVLGWSAGSAAVVFVYRQVFAIIREHKANGHTELAELRRLQNREDLREIMKSYMETQTEALVGIKDSLGKLTYIAEQHWK